MQRLLCLVSTLLISGAAPASAQDGMELQRCIWRCLAGRGNTDPAYHACVERNCTAAEPAVPQPPPPPAAQPDWRTDPLGTDGRSAIAADPGGTLRLTYNCRRDGTSFVYFDGAALSGLAPPVTLDVVVDGSVAYRVGLSPGGAGWSALIPPDSPLLAGLRGGLRADVRTTDGTPIGSVGLTGAAASLDDAIAFCHLP